MRELLRRRALLCYYALLTCALMILGTWAAVLYRNGESARLGTVVLIASSRAASALSTPSVRLRGPKGWADVRSAVTRQVPAAPANVQLAQAGLPSGTYDAMQVGGYQLGVQFAVSAGRVTPVLLVVSGGRPAAAYGGDETVSLALNELAGHLRSLSEFHLPCRTELRLLQQAADRSPSLAVVLVDERDDAGAGRQFLGGLHVRLSAASDPDGSIGARYRVAGLPATFFVRPDGNIASSRLGQLDESTLEEHLRGIGAI